MEKEKYTVDFGNGVTWDLEVDNLDSAKKEAEEGMSYKQENVYIKDPEGRVLLVSRWNGVQADMMDDVLLEFGSGGFYSTWENPYD